MSTYTTTPMAIAATVTGIVWVQSKDGTRRRLYEGDKVYEGEVIITEQGSTVEFKTPSGNTLKVLGNQEIVLAAGLFDNPGDSDQSDSGAPVEVVSVIGKVWVLDENGTRRRLHKGDTVHEGDTIITQSGSKVRLRNADGTTLSVTGNKETVLSSGIFDNQNLFDPLQRDSVTFPESTARNIRDNQQDSSSPYTSPDGDHGHGYIRAPRILESVVPVPYRYWSNTGNYVSSFGARLESPDALLGGRATTDERLVMYTTPLTFDYEQSGYVLREFEGEGEERTPNYLPKAFGETAVVVEGENTITGNLLLNDENGNGPSKVSAITYFPEGGGAPVTESVPAGGSLTANTQYGSFTINSDGTWSYLSDPTETHGADNVLKDPIVYTVSDIDGDIALSSLVIDVLDTFPVIGTPLPSSVDEDDLDNAQSVGTDPVKESVTVGGSLGVVPGEDPIDTYFTSQDAPTGLTSGGKEVKYYVSGDGHTLIAYTGSSVNPDGTPVDKVFSVEIIDPYDQSGSQRYEFTLLDQIDHPAAAGENTMDFTFDFQVRDSNEGTLDTDNGSFTVTVVDDVPILKGPSTSLTAISGKVYEDALGHESDSGDLSTGNQETIPGVTQVAQLSGSGTSGSQASLSTLFSIGADEPALSYRLTTDSSLLSAAQSGLTSNSETVLYSVNSDGSQLTATAGTRTVFTLNVSSSGTWNFDLEDQLDHSGSDSDSETMLANSQSLLNFTKLIEVTDADNDTVNLGTLGGSNSQLFTVTVENDIPIATDDYKVGESPKNQAWWSVEEGGVTDVALPDFPGALASNKASGNLLSGTVISGSLSGVDLPGADETIALVSFTYKNEAGTVETGTVGQWANTQYGWLKVMANGDFEYISDSYSTHTASNFLNEELTYTVRDADGDLATAQFKIKITDTDSDIDSPDQSDIYEKYLPGGSAPDATKTFGIEDIIVDQGKDPKELFFDYAVVGGVPDIGSKPITISAEESDPPLFSELTSKGRALTYTLSSDKRTLTASTTVGSETVFTVEILGNMDFNGTPQYKFTLYQPLDHIPDLPGDPGTEIREDEIDLMFDLAIWDKNEQLDKTTVQIPITIYDDNTLPTPKAMTVVEDSPTAANTITTSADATSLNTSVPAKGDTNGPKYGTAVVNANGTITYTPDGDYSGEDSFVYTHIDEDGNSHQVTVNVTVTPVSDEPDMADTSTETREDQPIPLGLVAPAITDETDLNGAAIAGDDSERFGLITLGGIPEGAQLLKSDGTVLFTGTATDNDVTIRLTDGLYMNAIPVAELMTLNTTDFNALKILPPPDSNVNFTVTMSVTEYEVDGSGNQKTVGAALVPGVTKTVNDVITVKAVTDRVDLQWKTTAPDTTTDPSHPDSFVDPLPTRTLDTEDRDYMYTTLEDGTLNKWIAEDSTFNLKSLLEYTAVDPLDTNNTVLGNPAENTRAGDTSETRQIVLSNLPVGAVVNGTTIDATGTISILLADGKTLPDITMTPPKDFSGDLKDIKVTLTTIDTESVAAESGLIVQEEDYVMLNLYVKPVADDIVSPDVSTPEDTSVKFMLGLVPTDTSTDPLIGGEEVITGITIKALPAGWKLYDENGVLLTTGTGADYTVASGDVTTPYTGDPTGKTFNYQYYTIKPPGHSSADIPELSIEVTSTDTSDPDGDGIADMVDTRTVIHKMKVTVTPMGEKIGADTDEDGQTDLPLVTAVANTDENLSADLKMNPSHDYGVVTATEDEWFKLHRVSIAGDLVNFDLKTPWSNEDTTTLSYQDSSEKTYALFTPQDSSGIDLTDSWFKYNDGSADQIRMYSGTPIEVPVEFLDTLEFKPPEHVAADNIKIIVNAKTVDTDQDPGGTVNTQITGKVVLTLDIVPAADQVTLAAYSPAGYEDGSSSALNPSPATPALPIPLYINPQSDDTDGSETFDIKISDIPDGAKIMYGGSELSISSGSVDIPNFNSSIELGIIPPANSDDDFVLEVTGTSKDGLNLSPGVVLNLPVQVAGVADTATLLVNEPTFVENNVDTTGNHRILLNSAITGSAMVDGVDGSESLTVKITGLDSKFDIEGATYLSGDGTGRIWVTSALSGVNIVVPNNYSGDITFTGTPVTSEREGSVLTGTAQSFTIHVTPSPESEMVLDTEFNEDQLTRVMFDIVQGPSADPDLDEQLQKVYLKVGGTGVPDGVENREFTLYYGAAGTKTLAQAVLADDIRIVTISGVVAYELDGTADYNNIYVRYGADTDGESTFKASYDIFDPSTGLTTTCCNDYTLTVKAVTDPITESLETIDPDTNHTVTVNAGYQTVSATGYTIFTVPVTVSQVDEVSEGPNGVDDDTSETLVKFVIDGVPQGVSVEGAVYAGDVWDAGTLTYVNSGRWIVYDGRTFDGSPDLTKDIVFNVDGTADELKGLNQPITIMAYSQDMGTDPALASSDVAFASATFTLVTPAVPADFNETGRPTDVPPTVTDWRIDASFVPVEDKPAALSELVKTPTVSGTGLEPFTVTLSGLPAGSVVAAVSGTAYRVDQFTQGGKTVYSISGSGGTTGLQDLLSKVTLTTPPDDNSNNSAPINLEMTITTYVPGSNQANAVATSTPLEITPVTDATTIIIAAPDVPEDTSETFTITFSNSADTATYTDVLADKLYIQLDESGMVPDGTINQGTLSLESGGTTVTEVLSIPGVTPVAGMRYFEVTGVDSISGSVELTYKPYNSPTGHASGSVGLTAYLDTLESNASNQLQNSQTATFDITPVNDLYVITSVIATGSEDDLRIPLVITGTGLIDTDGSEKVVSALLENVPDGYLVYYGVDSASATLALNVGDDGTGNTWALPLNSGALPAYIAVKPPLHVSGDVSGMQLTVYSRESELTLLEKTSVPFTLKVAPVADEVKPDFFKPTKTFGTEGALIPLNLNLILDDQDGSETATLTFEGLGAHASFYDQAGNEVVPAGYDSVNDIYTLSGIPAYDPLGKYDVNNLFVVQSARTGTVAVTAYTVDTASGYLPVDSSGSTPTASFTLDISEKVPTAGADTLLYDGDADVANTRSYDGLAGEDTLVLRKGEGIDFATDRSIFNIEKIDMTVSGANSLTHITWEDVAAMTDPSTHDLYILGDGSDSVQFASTGWSKSSPGGAYDEYTNTNDVTIKVYVQTAINDTIV